MTVVTDPSSYPISPATARQLERPSFGHVIEDEMVSSIAGSTMPVVDPATGERIATAAAGTDADVERAVQSARRAFDDGRWRFLAPAEQERRLRKLATLLAERGDEFAELDVLDAGLIRMDTGFIHQFAVDAIEYYSGWPTKLHGTIPAAPNEFAIYQLREWVGVVGEIIPWNGPTFGASMGIFPLCAGNSVVLKPAEQTPMTAVLMAELALEAGIPPGVFKVLQGRGDAVGGGLGIPSRCGRHYVHRLGAHWRRDPGCRGQAREACSARARRQESVDHLPRCRSRRGRGGRDVSNLPPMCRSRDCSSRHGDRGYFHEPTVFTSVRNDMEDRSGGDLRPGNANSQVRLRGRSLQNRQRHGIRASRGSVDRRPLAGASGGSRAARRNRLDKQVSDGHSVRPVWWRQAVRAPADAGRIVNRRFHVDQERVDEGIGSSFKPGSRRSAATGVTPMSSSQYPRYRVWTVAATGVA